MRNFLNQLKDHTAFVAIAVENIIGWIHAFIAITIELKPFVEIGGLVIDGNHRSWSRKRTSQSSKDVG